MKRFSKGFTVVELLVVIVVIAILASITIVAYNGIQDQARFAKEQTDLKHINDAIIIYKSQNGQYPASVNHLWGWSYQYFGGNYQSNFLSVIVPSYLDSMPDGGQRQFDKRGCNISYRSDGPSYADYKLLWLCDNGKGGLPSIERSNNSLIDPGRATAAWGYWTSGAAGW